MLDVKLELEQIKEDSDAAATAPAIAPGRRRRAVWIIAGGAVVIAAAALTLALWRSRTVSLPPPRVEPLTTLQGDESGPTFSPDGQHVAFAWNGEKVRSYAVGAKGGRSVREKSSPL